MSSYIAGDGAESFDKGSSPTSRPSIGIARTSAAGCPASTIKNSYFAFYLAFFLLLLGICLKIAPPAEYVVVPVYGAAERPQVQISPANRIWEGYPLLKRICAVESTGDRHAEPRQFYRDGTPVWGYDPKTKKPVMRDVGRVR